MKNLYRSELSLAIVAVIVIWPIVHIVLSSQFGLNSWKLGGWGMYASTEPFEFGLRVIVADRDSPPITSFDPVLSSGVVVRMKGEDTSFNIRATSAEVLSRLAGTARNFRVLGRMSDVESVLGYLEQVVAQEFSFSPDHSILLYSAPRLDLAKKHAYATMAVYFHRNGEVRKIGQYSSQDSSFDDILEDLRPYLRQEVAMK